MDKRQNWLPFHEWSRQHNQQQALEWLDDMGICFLEKKAISFVDFTELCEKKAA